MTQINFIQTKAQGDRYPSDLSILTEFSYTVKIEFKKDPDFSEYSFCCIDPPSPRSLYLCIFE